MGFSWRLGGFKVLMEAFGCWCEAAVKGDERLGSMVLRRRGAVVVSTGLKAEEVGLLELALRILMNELS